MRAGTEVWGVPSSPDWMLLCVTCYLRDGARLPVMIPGFPDVALGLPSASLGNARDGPRLPRGALGSQRPSRDPGWTSKARSSRKLSWKSEIWEARDMFSMDILEDLKFWAVGWTAA